MGNFYSSSKPGGNRRRSQQSSQNYIRKNERIRAPEVRVIDPEGNMLGVMSPIKARKIAEDLGYDLVEVSPKAQPPVCRILDFGKYMYELSKKQKDQKSNTSATKLKEIKLRVATGEHDYLTKLRHAEMFLDKGNKLKITLTFKGREMEHKELGFDNVKRAIEDLSTMGTADADPKLVNRNITVTMSPLPVNKRKRKFSNAADDVDTDDDDEDEED
jgi:translation initiation factor IF-3